MNDLDYDKIYSLVERTQPSTDFEKSPKRNKTKDRLPAFMNFHSSRNSIDCINHDSLKQTNY